MRSLGTRVALAAGAAMVAVIALVGCSAGQAAETALLKAPVSGLNTQTGDLLIRNLQVVYNSPEGYPAGASAPLEVSLFNQSEQPMTVLISSKRTAGAVSAEQVSVGPLAAPSASATPEPDPSASVAPSEPAAPALQPARFTIPPLGSETFLTDDEPALQAVGLSGALTPGLTLALTIEVEGSGKPLDVLAPFAIPTSPASRAPGVENENREE